MADGPTERHPIALFFHLAFKIAAFLWFVLFSRFVGDFVKTFVISLVLIALDFWTVKNVTGRKLVGLRWWNEANDSGSAWRFESAPEGTRQINNSEKRLFWIALMANCLGWGVLVFIEVITFKFQWLIIPIIGLIMGSSNLVGYFKCSREAKDQVKNMTNSLLTSAVTNYASNAVSRV
mmetsp:Transcript_36494/g.81251  ORF Transcript_36494/g.81251 Transcript_36494/m.81251 type:complete len:178 (-) Transcript_36494:728-1261(-)